MNENDDTAYEFTQFVVAIKTFDSIEKPVLLNIWAESLDAAVDCGEILSAFYLSKRH